MEAYEMQLKVPGKGTVNVEVYQTKLPRPEEIAILRPELLACTVTVGRALKDVKEMWAVGGDTGLVLHGVPVEPDRVEIITTRRGAENIFSIFSDHRTGGQEDCGWYLDRDAVVEGKRYPVAIRSYYGELDLDGTTVEVYGDKQIRVGEWEWGDPLEFEPEVTQVTTQDVNLVPLRFESELAFGLGWYDRSKTIAEAIARQRHRGPGVSGLEGE